MVTNGLALGLGAFFLALFSPFGEAKPSSLFLVEGWAEFEERKLHIGDRCDPQLSILNHRVDARPHESRRQPERIRDGAIRRPSVFAQQLGDATIRLVHAHPLT